MSEDTARALLPAVAADAASAKGRRRLWQLSTQAHELLLGTSFTPDALRREAARVLGRMHHGVCLIKGRDVDVLYSLVHDMVTRNPVSEAFDKRLNQAHALAVRRMASLRDAGALQGAWRQSLASDAMPAALWSLVTHPWGAALEASALYDARGWVFEHCRRGVAVTRARAQADEALQETRTQVDELRARLATQQQQARSELAAVRAEQARLVGALARSQESLAVAQRSAAAARPAPHDRAVNLPIWPPALDVVLAAPTSASPPVLDDTACRTEPASQPIVVQGRRVLCVGGIQHAVARYRSRIERLGGHFEHHDGGLEDGVQALDGRLSRAEIVICQAGCINHEAYQRVKRHCQRTGTTCVYLDRPSLSRLDRALHQTPAEKLGHR